MASRPPAKPIVPVAAQGSMTRTVAPFVPLAISMIAAQALIPSANTHITAEQGTGAAVKCEEVADFQQCHSSYPTGCSLSANYDGYLNLLKNRDTAPPPIANAVKFLSNLQDYQALESGTPQELTSKNHSQFRDKLGSLGEGQIYGVFGYLYYAKESGKESSNCELGDHDAVDYHIGIGFTDPNLGPKAKVTGAQQKQLEQSSVIVEMTPHYRFNYHPNWNIDAVRAVIGKQVRVVGQLLIDSEHNNASQNCGFPGADFAKCWRASSWELHPVMQFQVCSEGTCTATTGKWVNLDDLSPPADQTTTDEAAAKTKPERP